MCNMIALSSKDKIDLKNKGYINNVYLTFAQNQDGWGVVFFDSKSRSCSVIKDCEPVNKSALFSHVMSSSIKANNIIFHIRDKSAKMPVKIENAHPFQSSLYGRNFALVMNGYLTPKEMKALKKTKHIPLGDTDSEKIFCIILDKLVNVRQSLKYNYSKTVDALKPILHDFKKKGYMFNIFLTDSENIYCYRNSKKHTLYFKKTAKCAVVSKFAYGKGWTPLEMGDFVVLRAGELIYQGEV